MKLRARLLVAALAVGVPVLAILSWLQVRFADRAATDAIADFIRDTMQSGGREACESAPQSWSGGFAALLLRRRALAGAPAEAPQADRPFPRSRDLVGAPAGAPQADRPFPRLRDLVAGRGEQARARLYAYDSNLISRNPDAPALDQDLVQALEAGESSASRKREVDGVPVREVAVRMPWSEGPCAVILVHRPRPRLDGRRSFLLLPPLRIWLPPVVIVIGAVLIAAGPVVRRVRQLTREVRQSARAGYRPAISVKGRDEVGELARAFEDAGREIRSQMDRQEQRERTLRDFLENTTHDVMIPLTVIQGHLAAMDERLADGKGIEPAEVRSAMNEAHYMASLVHNLSAAAKLEAGEPGPELLPVDMNALLERVVARHRPLAARKGVSLDRAVADPPIEAQGDVTLIEQAVSNIVYNAVLYNQEGGHVAAVLEARAPDRFVLRVLDDGPGMEERDLARLLERRARGDAARTREPSGRGLGLAIALRVATLHGWELILSRSEFGGLQVEFLGPRR